MMPYGGLQKPIARFIVSIIPKVTGCIPMPVQIGSRIGVRIIVAGMLSTNMPTISRKMLIIKRISIAFPVSPSIPCAIIFGICAIVRNAANTVEKPTIKVVAPFTTIASLKD